MLTDKAMEVRFTRSRQAISWWLMAAFTFLVGLLAVVMALLPAPWGRPELQSFWWLLPFLLGFCYWCIRVGLRCVKHAYLIFSPVGVEIFPFSDPENKLDVVSWAQIDHFEMRGCNLILHFDEECTRGKVIYHDGRVYF